MNVDYYVLLAKAIADKDAAARDRIYKDAYALIRKSQLSRQEATSHIVALDGAIRRIEDEIAAEEERSSAAVHEVLATERNWKPWAVGGGVLVVAIALAAGLYGYVSTQGSKGPGVTSASVAPSLLKPVKGREDVVMADLKPGVDGGSTGEGLPFALRRQVVFYRTTAAPGSIAVDREDRFLYLIEPNNSARRYGIGIAQECLKGGSLYQIASKLEWPDWKTSGATTTDANALLAAAGKPGSLLGARALLLDKPGLLIHGTNSPKTIGHLVASGCIRLVNEDVEDLYRRVSLETRVIFVT